MHEEWRDVVGFEGLYQVSSFGNVRSLDRIQPHNYGGLKILKGRDVKQCFVPSGYLIVSLSKDGKAIKQRVNRLVLKAFVGDPPAGMQGCHNDSNKTNNAATNLRWDTAKGNARDKVVAGSARGENNPRSAFNECDVLKIRSLLNDGKAIADVARTFKVNASTISKIKSRHCWGHI